MIKLEINKNLLEFVWEYASTHDFVSRAIVSGKYMAMFEIKRRRDDRRTRQKELERRISSIFRITKHFGITERFSQSTVKINRAVFNNFTLNDILTFSFKKTS